MNGIGADAFCILWDGKQLVGLNAHGHSPALMTPDQYKGQDKMPHVGWGSVTTPGAVSLWMELHKRYGKLPFADLFEPGIKYARDGFRVSYMVARQWDRAIDRTQRGNSERRVGPQVTGPARKPLRAVAAGSPGGDHRPSR